MQVSEYALDGLRILVVEDEVLIAMMLEDLLKQAGAIVLGPVGTAAEALTLVEQNSLDCAVLDYKLVDGSSASVADALVKRDVPFVFASGCQPSVIDSRYPNALFIEKSFDRADLLPAISAISRRARSSVSGAVQAAQCLSCGKVSTVPCGPLIESEPHGPTDSARCSPPKSSMAHAGQSK
jgi:DNA-binding response OmpR family regulator